MTENTDRRLELLPAVDVQGGQAVRLVQGEAGSETGYGDPLEAARAWQEAGAEWLHLVDLDAAFGRGDNIEVLRRVAENLDLKIEMSGGIRDDESLERVLSLRPARINLGTAALENPQWTHRVIAEHGDVIAVGLDVRGTTLAARGWTRDGGDLWEVLDRLEADGCARYVVTDVTKDGTLRGPNTELLAEVARRTDKPVVASGGISSLEDIAALRELVPAGVEGAIVGKALYAGKFTLAQALDVAGAPVPDDAARPLPPHIAAQLRSAGGPTDTGGQAWEGRNLGEGTSHTHQFPDDPGTADRGAARALAAWRDGQAGEQDVVAALAGIRVFVPIVAQISRSHITQDGLVADKEADMALVSLQASDGRKALPVFTSTEALSAWNGDARPVAADIRRAALSAVQDGSSLLVVDPASDPAFVVRRPALWAVAQGREWTPSYRDFAVDDAVTRAAVGIPGIVSAIAEPGRGVHGVRADAAVLRGGGEGPELTVSLQLRTGLPEPEVRAAVQAFQEALAGEEVVAENVDSVQVRLTS